MQGVASERSREARVAARVAIGVEGPEGSASRGSWRDDEMKDARPDSRLKANLSARGRISESQTVEMPRFGISSASAQVDRAQKIC